MADAQRPLFKPWPSARELQRLGKNANGYFGETIDITGVLTDCLAAARAHGWSVEDLPVSPALNLLALVRKGAASEQEQEREKEKVQEQGQEKGRRKGDTLGGATGSARGAGNRSGGPVGSSRLRVYISTGIHGDEPAGPLAARHLLQENRWPAGVDLWLCPCLNPTGFAANRRENPAGLDLNRQYLHPVAPETLAHIHWLERQPDFDLCLCLHEDWESHGFYLYELNPEQRPSLAETMVEAVAEVCPIDRSELIEGRPAENGIIRPSIEPRTRPQWPEAFFLLTHKTHLSYTLEAPSDFPLASRVAALTVGVQASLRAIGGEGRQG